MRRDTTESEPLVSAAFKRRLSRGLLTHHLREALFIGVGLAACLSAFVLVGYALTSGASLRPYGVSLAAIVGAYFAAGVLSGVLVGVLYAWQQSAAGRLALAFGVVFIFYFCCGLTLPVLRAQPKLLFVIPAAGAVVGAPLWLWYARRLGREIDSVTRGPHSPAG